MVLYVQIKSAWIIKISSTLNLILLSFFKAVFFPLVVQIRFSTAQVDYFRTSIPLKKKTKKNLIFTLPSKEYSRKTYIFFQYGTLTAIISIRNTRTTTNHTSALIRAVVTLIAYSNQGWWPNVRVANHTFSIAFFTQAPNS